MDCDDISAADPVLTRVFPLGTEQGGARVALPAAFEFIVDEDSGQDGFWELEFINCVEPRAAVSLSASFTFRNGESFLPYGKGPVPWIYLLFSAIYCGVLALWVRFGLRKPGVRVFAIHYLMTLLVVLKILSLFFQSAELHNLKYYGAAGIFGFLYYFFALLKGLLLFTVIVLIGSGWSFLKPFLSDRERTIFLIVVPLQVIANFADVIVEETTPGTAGWFLWRNLLRVVDLMCCVAVLIPISWSIRHLRDTAQMDDKTKRNLHKLELFRQFYLTVMAYVYLTRILVFLFGASLPYAYVWIEPLLTEVFTLAFFLMTGYGFRPMDENPYLYVRDSDDEVELEVIDGEVDAESSSALPKPLQLDH